MGKTKDLLDHITKAEGNYDGADTKLEDLEILYEIIGPECDDSK